MRELRTVFSAVLARGRGVCLPVALAFGLSLLFAGAALAQDSTASQSKQPVQTAARSRVPAPAAAQRQLGASSPNSLQPLVSFEDGQLSVNAANVSLADVLFAVRAATGADIDIPMNASSERVTAQLGPGPARKVLSDLLAWSSFDYIIQGSDDDPLAVQSITLMVRVKSGAPGSTGAVTGTMALHQGLTTRPDTDPSPGGLSPASPDVAAVEPHTDQPVAAAASDAPDAPSNPQQKVQSPVSQPWGSGSGAGKSPSDMIQELQQMYQQRRMLQEQQNQATAGQRSP